MSLYKMYGTDKDVEKDGIILDYGDTRFRIARAGGANQKFKNTFKAKLKPYRKQMEQGVMDDDVALRLMAEAYAEAVILSWGTKQTDDEGNVTWSHTIVGEGGEELEFNAENCTKVLLDLPDLFSDIQEAAGQAANFRNTEMEEDAKN
jgi:hypothetical protein